MRQLAVFAGLVMIATVAQAAVTDDPVVCKASGAHMCCKSCENSIVKALEPVKGVTNVVTTRAKKEITFTADSADTAAKAAKALQDAGFGFTFKAGAKDVSVAAQKPSGKGDTVVVKGVHACCPACTETIKGLFKEATVTIDPKGIQRNVTVTGKNLVEADVLEALQKAGFTGTIESKK
jgi:copper chaperone CopZ